MDLQECLPKPNQRTDPKRKLLPLDTARKVEIPEAMACPLPKGYKVRA